MEENLDEIATKKFIKTTALRISVIAATGISFGLWLNYCAPELPKVEEIYKKTETAIYNLYNPNNWP